MKQRRKGIPTYELHPKKNKRQECKKDKKKVVPKLLTNYSSCIHYITNTLEFIGNASLESKPSYIFIKVSTSCKDATVLATEQSSVGFFFFFFFFMNGNTERAQCALFSSLNPLGKGKERQ